MSSDQLRHTLDLFAAARRLPAEERATFLDEACADDASLRREVEALLAHEHAAEFLTPPEGVEDLLGPITEMREFEESTPELPSDHPTQIGPFKIVAKLGEGGMGVVFEAIQESLGRRVALKILPGWFARDAKRVERFRREARATARIHHPNIVPVHEVGEAEGIHYYAMACIDGPSLDEVIGELRREAEKRRDGKSSATDSDYIANVVEQVAALAEGLHEAHALGLVHRDVKPSNVLVDKSGRYVLVDFGLVHEEDAQTITRSGETMGTLSYMSPEQLSGREVDARSDVYSLGVTLYEALTLRAPFEAKSAHDVKDGILFREPTPPRKLNGKVNRDLETIVLRALEKVPERRYSSASDFAADLRRFLRCEPIRARPQPAVRKLVRGIWRHKGKLAAALVVVVASVAAFLAWTYWPETRYTLRGLRSLTSHAGLTTEPSLSADGGLIAYASTLAGIGNLDIWTQPPEASVEPTRLTFHEADDREPVFSPDSKSIAFRSERDGGGIYVAPVDGGEKTSLLLIAKHGRRPRYSPDGARIAYWRGHEGGDDVRGGEIYVVSSAGGAPRKLQAHFLSARYPVWLPDGEQLLFYGNGTADPET
ncbi:MAG: protein kinase, partial [Planctomycetota bacterium]|nr:protein kinase [Planctomycetota bacterium]